jgi:hypothetical protein
MASIYFFERNPSGCGLDVDENPDQKADFLRYAIQLNCINPIRDITKIPLAPLEEITKGASIQLKEVAKHGTQSSRDLDVALRTASTIADWFPDNPLDCEHT